MTLWLDAQLSPSLAEWVREQMGFDCHALRNLGLRDASDKEIFLEARKQNAIVISKDADFVSLINFHHSPPKIIWLTCGNTSMNV